MPLPAALRAAARPIKPFTLADRLPFHSMRAHPPARQHKRTLCFAFSHRSPQTRMFERRAVVAGRAPPPPPPVLLASCPSRAGTQPGVSCRSQMGQRSSGGWLAEPEKQSRPTPGPPSWKITTKEPKSVAGLRNFIWHTDISYHVRAGRRPRLSAIPHE